VSPQRMMGLQRPRNARRVDANWMADGECREQA
jgi:hypothetical protein